MWVRRSVILCNRTADPSLHATRSFRMKGVILALLSHPFASHPTNKGPFVGTPARERMGHPNSFSLFSLELFCPPLKPKTGLSGPPGMICRPRLRLKSSCAVAQIGEGSRILIQSNPHGRKRKLLVRFRARGKNLQSKYDQSGRLTAAGPHSITCKPRFPDRVQSMPRVSYAGHSGFAGEKAENSLP